MNKNTIESILASYTDKDIDVQVEIEKIFKDKKEERPTTQPKTKGPKDRFIVLFGNKEDEVDVRKAFCRLADTFLPGNFLRRVGDYNAVEFVKKDEDTIEIIYHNENVDYLIVNEMSNLNLDNLFILKSEYDKVVDRFLKLVDYKKREEKKSPTLGKLVFDGDLVSIKEKVSIFDDFVKIGYGIYKIVGGYVNIKGTIYQVKNVLGIKYLKAC